MNNVQRFNECFYSSLFTPHYSLLCRGMFFANSHRMMDWKHIVVGISLGSVAMVFVACEAPRASAGAPVGVEEAPPMRASFAPSTADEPRLVRLYFHPYTDSIKPVLNYYVNVEGEYAGGRILPLDTSEIILRADAGEMAGNEWILPKTIDFGKVTFTAVSRADGRLRDTVTLWIQKWKDPRDAADYKDPEDEHENRRRR